MESRKQQGNTDLHPRRARAARCIAAAAGAALFGSMTWGIAHAQSTTGMIHGQAPAGDTVIAHSTSGFRRRVTVEASGKYTLRGLPLGVYSVTLKQGDRFVDMYHRVPLTVSRGVEVNFACPHDECAAPGSGDHSS